NPNPRAINMIELGKALTGELETTKETPIKQLFVYVANPMTSTPNVEKTRKGLERDDLFTVVSDIFHTDTVDYADIVLPATTLFEQEDLNQDYLAFYVRYNEPAIKPLGEAKSNIDMFKGLAKAMGFTDPEFDLTSGEIIQETLENAGSVFGGLTYEELKEKHWHKLNPGVPYGDMKFPTPSGKIEFYSESIQKDAGLHPVAEYVPLKESKEGNAKLYSKYPLTFLTLTTKNLLNGQMSQVEHIQAVNKKPVIFMNPEDANKRGIKDGDRVVIKNDRGECKLIAKLSSEKVIPGVVLAYKSPWQKILGRTNINSTTSDELSDIGGGSTFHTNLVDVIKE
ncbi:MAG: molybdopterin-containing oxidoreductase family protein, partial [Turicibacter sp.]